MKTRTKALLLVMSALLLVVSTVFATLAYLTSTTEVVKNTFTVGNVTITLDEAKVDEYGVEDEEANRVTANTYKLLPGHTYVKDPVIHVKGGSEVCYLFIKVNNQISGIEAAGKTVANQIEANGWTAISTVGSETIYGKATPIDAREVAEDKFTDVAVFESINIDNQAVLTDYEGKTITVQACAIQADGFNDMSDAWRTGFNSTFPIN